MSVPNGLAPDIAALTEPMAVGLHAVRRGEVAKKRRRDRDRLRTDRAGRHRMLKATGVRTIVASDFSAGRRALAEAMRRRHRRGPRGRLAV